MERPKWLLKGGEQYTSHYHPLSQAHRQDMSHHRSREQRQPHSSTLPGHSNRLRTESPAGFQLNELPYSAHTPIEQYHEHRYQTDRKRSQSRGCMPVGSFKKIGAGRLPTSDTPTEIELKDIPKLKLPSSGCHEQPHSSFQLSSYKRPFCTDRSMAYNARLPLHTPLRDNKPIHTDRRSRSPEQSKHKPAHYQPKYFQERQQYHRSIAQDLKETLSTLSTNIYAPIRHVTCQKRSRRVTIEDFQLIRQLGTGKSSSVFMVRDTKTGVFASLKCIKKELVHRQHMLSQIVREVKIGSYCRHPNIIALYGFFDNQDSFYMLSELACDGQLYKKLKRVGHFSEEGTAFIVRQVLQAVAYLHQYSIYHRDIKPQNIVLCHGIVKLCDFGWSVNAQGRQLRDTVCGTPLYASPEILQGQRYDQKIDLWAIGMLAYELYFGHIPFDIKLEKDLIRIITDDVKFPAHHDASFQFKDFIQSILQKNPCDRLSCQELLKHPYIARYRGFETCEEVCSA